MNSEALSITDIDAICSRFETNWSTRSAKRIHELAVGGRLVMDSSYAELFGELVQIDLEQRWKRTIRKISESNLNQFEPSDLNLPSMEDYLKLPGAMGVGQEVMSAIEDCNQKCSMRYGTARGATSASKFANFRKYLPRVKVSSGPTNEATSFQFYSPLCIGRQAAGEPSPVQFEERINKLVTAPLSDRKISRKMILVDLFAGQVANVANTGTRSSFRVCDDRQLEIQPGQSLFVRFPFTVSLDGLTLYFSRQMSSGI